MPPLLTLTAVSATDLSGLDPLLTDISFTVNPGDRLGIEGPSGAGKSTLLRLLNRLQERSGGSLMYQDRPLESYPVPPLRQQIMLVPQEPKLLDMTVEASLLYPLQLQKIPHREAKRRVAEACDFWQIPPDWLDRNELTLSVGQRQRVTIARGAIVQPQILLLDEPTSALDPDAAQRVLACLTTLNHRDQLTVIMVNHHAEQLRQFAHRIIRLESGRLMGEEPAPH
ncbi:MAG: ATP-binding cassette domain-containing protein [Synechocystis sp.]|jgi:D-methionine transport system ATP-binding protein|nr:ATP-binding cassette domain-containing protein [Synechocystis sp.]